MIEWRQIKKHDLVHIVSGWTDAESIRVNVPAAYRPAREALLKHHDNIKRELGIETVTGKEYQYDLRFGLSLYEYLNNELGLKINHASDDSFWVFMGIEVVPDIVFWRWGPNANDRFFASPRRIWLKTLWWYIHLSWQGDLESTRTILEGNTTDEIVQLVERSGSQGYRVELCRAIMRFYAHQGRKRNLFRRLMKLNTARSEVLEPALFEGKEDGYVKELFNELIAN